MTRLALTLVVLLLIVIPVSAQTATITWGTTNQVMDGFGGQTWLYAPTLTGANADLFFSPTAGIGMEYVRTMNTGDGSFPDLTTVQSAVARGASIELGFQTPPCSIKHSSVDLGEPCSGVTSTAWGDGTEGTSGTCLLNAATGATYTTWANYMVNYINTVASSSGARVSVIDVQNEPNTLTSSLGACEMNAAGFDTLVKAIGLAFAGASWNGTQGSSPQIMFPSVVGWFSPDYASTCMNDATCAQYVDIVAGHGYAYPHSPAGIPTAVTTWMAANPTNHLWLSETGAQSGCDTGMTGGAANGGNGLIWAANIHAMLTANVSALEWWELAYAAASCNFGLTTDSFSTTKRLYVEGQWSKFVRPGWLRVAATAAPQTNVSVTAFKNPAGTSGAIVAINSSGAIINQTFTISGATVTSVTPNVTSPTLSLAAQSPVTVTGGSYTYPLPLDSVTTFTFTTGGGPPPPTGCPSAANYTPTSQAAAMAGTKVTLAAKGITGTCYYISNTGSDSAAGTSKATAWAHMPGQPSATGLSLAHTPQPGEGYIFEGGNSWSAPDLGFTPHGTGNSTAPIYIGVDQTWFSGASWTRPVWSCGGAYCTGLNNGWYIEFGAGSQYWIVDNIEFSGGYSGASTQGQYYIGGCGPNQTFENNYMHGWSHSLDPLTATAATITSGFTTITMSVALTGVPVGASVSGAGIPSGSTVASISGTTVTITPSPATANGTNVTLTFQWNPGGIGFATGCGNNTAGMVIRFNVVDGTGTSQDMFTAMRLSAPNMYGNYFGHVVSGATGCGDNWHDNTVDTLIGPPGGAHQDGLYQYLQCYSPNSLIYNNVIKNTTFAGSGGSVKLWLNGNGPCPFGSTATSCVGYAFNNVLFNNLTGNMVDTGGHLSGVFYGTWYFFNNTIQCGTDGAIGVCAVGMNTGATMNWFDINNHYIQSVTTTPMSCTNNPGGTCTQTTPLLQTLTQANLQGYTDTGATTSTPPYAFQPTVVTGLSINTGTPQPTLCANINSVDPVAGAACLNETSYACTYNQTPHTMTCTSIASPTPRGASWDRGAYEFGTSVGAPAATFTPSTTVTFPITTVGVAATPQNVVLTNTGTATLVVSSMTLGGTNAGDFNFSTTPSSTCGTNIVVSGSCTISTGFTPLAAGGRSATLTIVANDSGSPHVITLLGTGVSPSAANPVCTPGSGTFSPPPNPSVTCTDAAPVQCYSVDGITTPGTNGTTGCFAGSLYTGAITISSSTTLQIVAGGTGFADSSVVTYNYLLNPTAVAPPIGVVF